MFFVCHILATLPTAACRLAVCAHGRRFLAIRSIVLVQVLLELLSTLHVFGNLAPDHVLGLLVLLPYSLSAYSPDVFVELR